ncbi:MAG: hypothetical protein K2M46_09240 [Lachnospiraceae bacterium]|nr:hypothetical protein [Lachnospiraceae bacterium]
MNFIDKVLAKENKLSDDDILQAMADIYDEPEVRNILDNYPLYIRDVISIIDYDTELQMEGLEGVLEGDLSQKYTEIHSALLHCGAVEEACIIAQAKQLDIDSENYDEQIAKLQMQTALYNDYEHFWYLVRNYIGKHRGR